MDMSYIVFTERKMPRVTKFVQTLNKAQQKALKRVFDRGPVYHTIAGAGQGDPPMTYRQFRKRVQFSYDCAMVYWCGMWLGIEEDGYIHS